MKRDVFVRCFVLAVAVPTVSGAAEQRSEFGKPILLKYGDVSTIAPMMGPSLTVDWDRDGLADLVSGGRWWRNTGRKHDGLALFEPGGSGAVSAVMIGDLDGDAHGDVVIASNKSYTWFEDTTAKGTRKFAKRGTLAFVLGGNLAWPERGEGSPSCWLADWDGDGRTDLLVGTRSIGLRQYLPGKGPGFGVGWRDGGWVFRDMTATVWLHRNVGTAAKPVFTAGRFVRSGKTGRAITFFDRTDPCVVDWNGDGKQDLIVYAFDRVVVFLNTGTPSDEVGGKGEPELDDGRIVTFDRRKTIPYERKTFCPFRDEAGLWHVRFGGPTASEAVQLRKEDPFAFGPLRMMPFRNPDMAVDTFSVPDAADWDGDGKVDLVVGCEDGWIWFFKNLDPGGGIARWAPPVRLRADGKPIRLDKVQCLQGPCEWLWGYSNPTAADWDLDGDLDLICGSVAETYHWFENVGTKTAPKLAARGPLRCGDGAGKPVSCAWRTRPGVGDVDGDKLPDLVGVAGSRQLCWWRRTRDAAGKLRLDPPAFPLDAKGKPFEITGPVRATGRTKIVMCDWDHDGRCDIITSPKLGGGGGYQYLFRNLGLKDGKLCVEHRPKQIRVTGHITRWTHFSMVEPVDFDGDGQWEVLAGMDRGVIYYWKE